MDTKTSTGARGWFAVVLLALFSGAAQAVPFTVDARSNSISGGTGLDTGILLSPGQLFSVSVDPNDLWSAGFLPRWSNADGLTGPLYATGTDESGQPAGTLIGADFGLFSAFGLSAPYGSLVGELSGTFFVLGTSFSGPAPAAGTLRLWYWDSNNGDNADSVVAEVLVSGAAVPEPHPLLLLLPAFAGLFSLRLRRG